MKTESPQDLFFDQVQDLYSVETQLVAALPHLLPLTSLPELRDLLVRHAGQTERQRQMVIKIFQDNGVEIGNDSCKAMKGLIDGGYAHLEEVTEPKTRDLMMIAHCLRIEYYEIAAYSITARLAASLNMTGEAGILHEILSEEEKAAEHLLALEPLIFDLATAS